MNYKKTLISSYFINIVNVFIAFSIPYFLTVYDYAVYASYQSIVSLVTILAFLGFDFLFNRYYFEDNKEESITNTLLVFFFIPNVIIAHFVFSIPLFVSISILAFGSIQRILSLQSRAKGVNSLYMSCLFIPKLIMLIFIAYYYHFDIKVEFYYHAVASVFLMCFIFHPKVYCGINIKYLVTRIKSRIGLVGSLLVFTFCTWSYTGLPRLIFDETEIANFGIAASLTAIIMPFVRLTINLWQPYYYKNKFDIAYFENKIVLIFLVLNTFTILLAPYLFENLVSLIYGNKFGSVYGNVLFCLVILSNYTFNEIWSPKFQEDWSNKNIPYVVIIFILPVILYVYLDDILLSLSVLSSCILLFRFYFSFTKKLSLIFVLLMILFNHTILWIVL